MNLYERMLVDQDFLDEVIATKEGNRRNHKNPFSVQWPLIEMYGYHQPQNQYSAVLYIPDKISVKQISFFDDAISFGFSGCDMCTFVLDRRDRYVAHIPPNYKNNWTVFLNEAPVTEAYMFNPMKLAGYNEFTGGRYPSKRIYGIIDRNNQSYALVVLESHTGHSAILQYLKNNKDCKII